MKEFIPSRDFVKNTMAGIRRIEHRRQPGASLMRAVVQYGGALCAILLGLVNLARLLATVYAPVVCR